jgi:hypothetical protein
MQGENRTQRSVRTAWLPGPCLWVWEIVDLESGRTVESSWTSGWTGYSSGEEAHRAGINRLADLSRGVAGAPAAEAAGTDGASPLLIIVPRTRSDLYRSLRQSFGDDGKVQVVLDRRFRERRARVSTPEGGRRRGDRRLRTDVELDLRAGRWVAVRVTPGTVDFRDPDARAILFLCCSEHVVPCARCRDTYGVRWLTREASGSYACPRCRADLTAAVALHTRTCTYWAGRMPATKKWPSVNHQPQAEAATG